MLARWDLYANDGDNFTPPDEYCRKIVLSGYGNDASEELVGFWTQRIKAAYVGEAGRQRLIMMAINLKERDGLTPLLPYIEKPVLWMQVCHVTVVACLFIESCHSLLSSWPATDRFTPGYA